MSKLKIQVDILQRRGRGRGRGGRGRGGRGRPGQSRPRDNANSDRSNENVYDALPEENSGNDAQEQ